MTDTIRWCFTHDHRYDGDASCAAFVGECDTSCEVETLLSRAEWEATIKNNPVIDMGDDNLWVMVDLGNPDAVGEETT